MKFHIPYQKMRSTVYEQNMNQLFMHKNIIAKVFADCGIKSVQ